MFDRADVYSSGLAETILNEAIKGKRNRVLISTKLTFPTSDGPNDYGSSRIHLLQSRGQVYNTPVERRWRRSTSWSARASDVMSARRISEAGT